VEYFMQGIIFLWVFFLANVGMPFACYTMGGQAYHEKTLAFNPSVHGNPSVNFLDNGDACDSRQGRGNGWR
jgi:hypothetical protein